MPLIEELPITQSHRATHGWAYVPDTGPAPIAAVQLGSRKRGRDQTAAATANATAKQQKAIQARLEALDKENYKDGVSVPIPARPGADKKRDRKTTTNVKRILTYQRTFAHYLADEEANAAAGIGTIQAASITSAKTDARRKASTNANSSMTTAVSTEVPASEPSTPAATKPARRGRPPGRPSAASKQREKEKQKEQEKMLPPSTPSVKQEEAATTSASTDKHKEVDTIMTDTSTAAPSTSSSQPTSDPVTSTPATPKPLYDPKLDSHPLLRTTGLPKMPSSRVMSILTSEPPLSYSAAKAKFPDDSNEKPVRRFCGICGYWGKVKCRKCGEWTCGLMECWRGHEGVCVAQGMF